MDNKIVVLLCLAFLPAFLCMPLVWIARSENATDNDGPEEVDLNVIITNETAEYYREGTSGDVISLPKPVNISGDGPELYVSLVESERYWKDGLVPYSYYNTLDSTTYAAIQDAMRHIQDKSCIRFQLCEQCVDRVVIQTHDEGCYSSTLGRQGGTQILNFGAGCLSRSTILHELLHVIGFYHEQNRPDRDQFLIIDWNNINDKWKDQFAVYANPLQKVGKFDYTSIMMYSGDNLAISIDGRRYMRPVPKIGKYDLVNQAMGHVLDLSQGDIKKLNAAYCTATTTTAEPNRHATTTTANPDLGGVMFAIGDV